MSDVAEEMEQDAQELVTVLENPVLLAEAQAVQALSPMEDLKQEVLGFFKNRISSISRAERIKELMYQQLEVDIQSGGLSFDNMMTLLMRLDRDNNDAADSLLRAMTGGNVAGGAGSTLFNDIVRPDSDKSDLVRAIESYTPEERRKINDLANVLRDLVDSGATVSVNTPDGKIPVAEV